MLAAVLLARCATVIHHDMQEVPVASTPAGADVTLDCGRGPAHAGTTPFTLILRRRDSHCSIVIVKSGWTGARVDFHRLLSAAALSDVAAGLLTAAVVGNSELDFSAQNGTPSGGTVNVSASGSGSVSPAAAGAFVFSGAVVVDVASGALFAQSPKRVDVTLARREPN